MATIHIKNWDHFQHYRDRKPPWIKFHVDVLQNYDFNTLASASKAHLVILWLLASRYDNNIPADDMQRLKWETGCADLDLKPLESHGFIVIDGEVESILLADDSERLQDATSETEAETEKEKEGEARSFDLSPKVSKTDLKSAFAFFWDAWADAGGRKLDRARSEEAFGIAFRDSGESKPHAFAGKLAAAIEKQAEDRQNLERAGEFVAALKNPKTWLRGKCWEDDLGHAVDAKRKASDKDLADLKAQLEAEDNQ